MSLRVLFSHTYFLRLDAKQLRAAKPYAPLGTLYAAAAARAAGHHVAFHDVSFAGGAASLDAPLASFRPDVLVLWDDGFNWQTKMCLGVMQVEALAMVRRAVAHGCRVVVSGSDASDHRRRYLEAGASVVILGEDEATLVALLAAMERAADAASIAGLAWLSGGDVAESARRRGLPDLDALAPPAWDLADLAPYARMWRKHHGRFSVNLVSSRGCPYGCNWCAKPLFGRQYAVQSPARLVDDLQRLRSIAPYDHVWFGDDIFGLTAAWCEGFAQALEAAAVRVPFMVQTRADLMLDPGIRASLVRAGLQTAWLGAESGSQRILDAMDKDLTVAQTREAVRLLRRDGVRVGLFLQYGYLGETEDDVRQTIAMVAELVPDEIGISVSYPLPGTKFHDKVKATMRGKTNWVDSDDLDPLYARPQGAAYYRRLHRYTHRVFRARLGLRSLREIAARPHRATRAQLRAAAAAPFHLAMRAVDGAALRRHARGAPPGER